MATLLVTAVQAERDAAVAELGSARTLRVGGHDELRLDTPAGELHVVAGGVGPVAAAATTAALLALGPRYELVVSAGLAGGFAGRCGIGDLVLADEVVAADQGVLTGDGFHTLRELGLPGDGEHAIGQPFVRARLVDGPYRLVDGGILTLSCMTGTAERAAELAARHPHAAAEAMEGYGVLEATRHHFGRGTDNVPFVEIRAISNVVGPRDPSTWNIPAAFKTLAAAVARLVGAP